MNNKTDSIFSILRKRYPENEYALMEEVSDKAGFSRSRSADYIVMNLWPSRGLSLNGVELKSFRGDWLSELKKPQKAENIFQYCDYFWLLTADDTVAKIEEIPEAWGWLCIKGNRIYVKKEAPKLTPKEISRHFLAAMLKRACSKDGYIRHSEIEDRIEQARLDGMNEQGRELNRTTDKVKELRGLIDEYAKSSGINLMDLRWRQTPQDIGKAVKFISDGGAGSLKDELIHLESVSKDITQRITKGLEALIQLPPPVPKEN